MKHRYATGGDIEGTQQEMVSEEPKKKKSSVIEATKNFLGEMVPAPIANIAKAYKEAQGDYSGSFKKAKVVPHTYTKGGKVKAKVSSASKRGDGIAKKGKTRGRFV